MKAYNLTAKKIEMPFGQIEAIELGEKGRGRYLEVVPCPMGIQNGESVDRILSRTSKTKIERSAAEKTDGWLARICTDGPYTRGTTGKVQYPQGAEYKVLAKGYGAAGDAGRLGTWDDVLVSIPDNTIVRVKPFGGSKSPAYYLFFGEEQAYKISGEELEIAAEQLGFDIPEVWE